MIWKSRSDRWHRRFALLPLTVAGSRSGWQETIWLRWYWSRPYGEYNQVSLEQPADGQFSPKAQPHDQ